MNEIPSRSLPGSAPNPPIIVTPNVNPVPKARPAGWWSLNEEGLTAAVVAKIQASTIPDSWKAAIIADIQSLGDFNYFSVHAGCQIDKGKSVKHFTLTGKIISV